MMSKCFLLTFILALAIPVLSMPNRSQKVDNQKKEIKAFIETYYQAMSDRNWKAYETFFASKATLTTIWNNENSIKEITTYSITDFLNQTMSGPDSQPIFNETPLNMRIEVRGNLASVWVEYKAKFGTEEKLLKWKGYDLFSLIKLENKWKISSIAYSAN